MKQARLWRAVLVLVTAVALTLSAGRSGAAEKAWPFIEGLRQRGYHDTVLEYLDKLATSPACPEDLRQVLDYEAGKTLMAIASATPPAQRDAYLEQATERFRKFLSANARHAQAADASNLLADVLVKRGQMKMEMAAQPNRSAEQKQQLLAEARAGLEQAEKSFTDAEKRLYELLRTLGDSKEGEDATVTEQREQARGDYLRTRLFLAGVVHEIGKTYPAGSEEQKKRLADAAKRYNELFTRYAKNLEKPLAGGYYARLQEIEIFKALGQTDQAVAALSELMNLVPDDPEPFRNLKNQALVVLLETYSAPKPGKYAEALQAVAAWKQSLRGGEESSPVGLKIQFLAGQAALKLAEQQKEAEARRTILAAARQHFEHVRRFAGEHRLDAQRILMNPPFGAEAGAEEPLPQDYAEARARGDSAWDQMIVADGMQRQAKAEADEAKAAALLNKARDDAVRFYEMAVGLRTAETPVNELSEIRFRLAYLYWAKQDVLQAALLGEFLARRYPQSARAQKAAEIAVKAFRLLYTQDKAAGGDGQFEKRHMTAVAEYITSTWAEAPEAQEARLMLIDTAVDERDIPTAQGVLAKIPTDNPARAEAELRVGQALWSAYIRAGNLPEQERPAQEQLDQLVAEAQTMLEQGVARMVAAVEEGAEPDYGLLLGILSLVQIYNDAGQPEKALTWLDHPKVGLMTLVKAAHPATKQNASFATEVYRAALRGYVGAQQIEKAEETMDGLEKRIAASGDAAAVQRLTQEYVLLGRELEEQLTRLRKEGKAAEAAKVAKAFESFLSHIKQRGDAVNFSSLNWVASTFYGLGAGIDPGGKEPPAEAKGYYKEAMATYLDVLKRIGKDPAFAPAGAETTVKVRLAQCLRGMNMHTEAMKLLAGVLKQNERRVDVQIAAAEIYQDWALHNPGYYEKAIVGGLQEEGRNLAWGWGGIAQRVSAFGDKYRDIYHQARYNLARCRLELALTKQGDEKTKLLQQAKLDITRLYRLDEKMGGAEWYAKYDDLLKKIQQLLNEKPLGLKSENQVAAAPVGSR